MPRLAIDSCALTDIGSSRQLNEDSCFATSVVGDPHGLICSMAVADGMGGHDAGDVASKTTADFLQHLFTRGGYVRFAQERGLEPTSFPALIAESFHELNRKILDRAASFNLSRTMGTTCTLGLIVQDPTSGKTQLYFGSIGDSRCYIIRGTELLLTTKDDSHVWELYEAGEIKYSDIRIHPKRHIITQALGISESIKPQVNRIDLQQDDRVVMSTDGLHGMIGDQEIKGIVSQAPEPMSASMQLIAAALRVGGKDNVSVAIAYAGVNRSAEVRQPKRHVAAVTLGVIAVVGILGLAALFFLDSKEAPTRPVPKVTAHADTSKRIDYTVTFGDPQLPLRVNQKSSVTIRIESDRGTFDQNNVLVECTINDVDCNREPTGTGKYEIPFQVREKKAYVFEVVVRDAKSRERLVSKRHEIAAVDIQEPPNDQPKFLLKEGVNNRILLSISPPPGKSVQVQLQDVNDTKNNKVKGELSRSGTYLFKLKFDRAVKEKMSYYVFLNGKKSGSVNIPKK